MYDESPTTQDLHGDANVRASALPDDPNLEAEMAAAFGWDEPLTDEEIESMMANAPQAQWNPEPLPEVHYITNRPVQIDLTKYAKEVV